MDTLENIKNNITSRIPGAEVAVEGSALVIGKAHWLEAARILKTHPDCKLDYLSSVTAVDYKDYLESVYHIYSIERQDGPLTVKVRTNRSEAALPSVCSVWRSAEYQEREAYDLLGIQYDNHPDLRRILMWEGFEHYPLRKDYVMEDQNRDL